MGKNKKYVSKRNKYKADHRYIVYYIAAFVLLLSSILTLYYLSSPGILISFDDSIYAYSIIQPSVLGIIPWGVSAFGFAIFSAPFYYLLNHSLESLTIACLAASSITLLCLFLIGWKIYEAPIMGILAAALYGLNPITVTFTIRFLPDPFIAMADAIGLVIALLAIKRSKYRLLLLSGIAVGAGLFFGNQAIFSILAFSVFVSMLIYVDKKKANKPAYKHVYLKPAAFLLVGFLIMAAIYLSQEAIMYGNPLYSINGESAYYALRSSQNFPTYMYYFYLMFPIKYTSGFPNIGNSGILPYSNMSILAPIFIIALLFVLPKKDEKWRSKILPYMLFVVALYLMLSFMPEGLVSGNLKLGVQDISRVFIPGILFMAVGSSLVITKIRGIRLQSVIAIFIIIIYVGVSFSSYNAIASTYHNSESNQWAITRSIIKNFGSLNIKNYTVIENYTNQGYLLCMGFVNAPYNCEGVILPQQKISCSFYNMIVVHPGPEPAYICGKSGKTYDATYYYNSTYNYSVYIKRTD